MRAKIKRRESREWTLKFLFQQEFLESSFNQSSLSLKFQLQKFFYLFQTTHLKTKKKILLNQTNFTKKNLSLPQPLNLPHHYTRSLIKGIYNHKEKIDQMIKSLSHHWSFERILLIDLNILRIAIYEIYFGNVPPRVAINEALNISKKYSTKDSSSFINALLDKVLKAQDKEEKKLNSN